MCIGIKVYPLVIPPFDFSANYGHPHKSDHNPRRSHREPVGITLRKVEERPPVDVPRARIKAGKSVATGFSGFC